MLAFAPRSTAACGRSGERSVSVTALGDGGSAGVVDPVTLGAIVAALVAKASDKAVEAAVGGGAGALGRLVGWLRGRFSDDTTPEEAAALTKVEEVPHSATRVGELAAVVDRRAADPAFRAELEAMVEQVRTAGVDVGSIAQSASGDQNVQIAGVASSTITTTQGQPPPGH